MNYGDKKHKKITKEIIGQLKSKVKVTGQRSLIKTDALWNKDEDKNSKDAELEELAINILSQTVDFDFQTAIKMIMILKSLKTFENKSLLNEIKKFRPEFKLRLSGRPNTLFHLSLLLTNVVLNKAMAKKGQNKLNKLKK